MKATANVISANTTSYDNSTSELSATTVQGAIDEVNSSKLERVLLWNNSTNIFSGGQINISTLYQYNLIAIVFTYTEDASSVRTYQFFKPTLNGKGYISISMLEYSAATSFPNILSMVSREFKFNSSGIYFEGSVMKYLGDIYINWNNRCVPREIYGFK